MDPRKDPGDLPSEDPAIEEGAQRSREAEEDIPPPGTDPLHEGP